MTKYRKVRNSDPVVARQRDELISIRVRLQDAQAQVNEQLTEFETQLRWMRQHALRHPKGVQHKLDDETFKQLATLREKWATCCTAISNAAETARNTLDGELQHYLLIAYERQAEQEQDPDTKQRIAALEADNAELRATLAQLQEDVAALHRARVAVGVKK